MKTYHGYRPPVATPQVAISVCEGDETRKLDSATHTAHFGDTLDWRSFSGAEQLAFALIADCCGVFTSGQIVRHVCRKLVIPLPMDGWSLTEDQVRAAVDAAQREVGPKPAE
jgi:hypothetical protein